MSEGTTSSANDDTTRGGGETEVVRAEDVQDGQDVESTENVVTAERAEPPATAGDAPDDSDSGTDSDTTSDTDADDDADASADAAEGSRRTRGRGSDELEADDESDADRVSRLEREGDIAADYLEELLDIADVDGDIDLDVEGDRAMVAIVGEGLGHLVGEDGAVLDALQDLTRLTVLRKTGVRSRLMLDVAGYRERRRHDLIDLASKLADEVAQTGKPARLDPMTPFERKIVHDAVAAKGLSSESEGEDPDRRVVIHPAS